MLSKFGNTGLAILNIEQAEDCIKKNKSLNVNDSELKPINPIWCE